jgi:hypothetical protein
MRWLLAAVILAALAAGPVAAQETPVRTVDPFDAVSVEVLRLLATIQAGATSAGATSVDALARAIDRQPRISPVGKQVSAPSLGGSSGPVVDLASFPELFGLALDNNLVQFGQGAFTLDLNLFGFRTLFGPEILDRQSLYGSRGNSLIRRFGGAISLGGAGDTFDADGDGTPETVPDAAGPFDMVTWEVRVRVLGSRDRRDDVNFRRYEASVLAPDTDLGRAIGDFIRAHIADIDGMLVNNVLDADRFNAFLQRPDIARELAAIVPLADRFVRADAAVTTAIDRAAVWTLIAGGTERKPEFGPQKFKLGLRGVAGTGVVDHTWNVDWMNLEGLAMFPDATTWKAGYQATARVLQGTALTADGIEIAVAAAAEHYRNVPGARHDTVMRASATLELPIGAGMKLPVSMNYANHPDLLTDQNRIVGHIGFAIDLAELRKKRN